MDKIGNSLIAQYIGVDIFYSSNVYKDSKSPLRHLIDNRLKSEGLEFDSNWEWLMPVVEIINQRDWVTIYGDECKIHSSIPNEFETIRVIKEDEYLIKPVFNAVVQYVEWYLENKKNKIDLRECEEGDILISSHGAKLKYIRPTKGSEYLDHYVQYIEFPDGAKPHLSFGTRSHDGYVFRYNRKPETDHDIVKIIKKSTNG